MFKKLKRKFTGVKDAGDKGEKEGDKAKKKEEKTNRKQKLDIPKKSERKKTEKENKTKKNSQDGRLSDLPLVRLKLIRDMVTGKPVDDKKFFAYGRLLVPEDIYPETDKEFMQNEETLSFSINLPESERVKLPTENHKLQQLRKHGRDTSHPSIKQERESSLQMNKKSLTSEQSPKHKEKTSENPSDSASNGSTSPEIVFHRKSKDIKPCAKDVIEYTQYYDIQRNVEDEGPFDVLPVPRSLTLEEVRHFFRYGFRPDHQAKDGHACFSPPRRTKGEIKQDLSIICIRDTVNPMDFILDLGYDPEEAALALSNRSIKDRLHASIVEAQIWANYITIKQGTLIFFLSHVMRGRAECFFTHFVEAIVNYRITNATQIDGYIRVLHRIGGGLQISADAMRTRMLRYYGPASLTKNTLLRFTDLYMMANDASHVSRNAHIGDKETLLLEYVVLKLRPGLHTHVHLLARYIGHGLVRTKLQVDAAIMYLILRQNAKIDHLDFERFCGIGVKMDPKECCTKDWRYWRTNKEAESEEEKKFRQETNRFFRQQPSVLKNEIGKILDDIEETDDNDPTNKNILKVKQPSHPRISVSSVKKQRKKKSKKENLHRDDAKMKNKRKRRDEAHTAKDPTHKDDDASWPKTVEGSIYDVQSSEETGDISKDFIHRDIQSTAPQSPSVSPSSESQQRSDAFGIPPEPPSVSPCSEAQQPSDAFGISSQPPSVAPSNQSQHQSAAVGIPPHPPYAGPWSHLLCPGTTFGIHPQPPSGTPWCHPQYSSAAFGVPPYPTSAPQWSQTQHQSAAFGVPPQSQNAAPWSQNQQPNAAFGMSPQPPSFAPSGPPQLPCAAYTIPPQFPCAHIPLQPPCAPPCGVRRLPCGAAVTRPQLPNSAPQIPTYQLDHSQGVNPKHLRTKHIPLRKTKTNVTPRRYGEHIKRRQSSSSSYSDSEVEDSNDSKWQFDASPKHKDKNSVHKGVSSEPNLGIFPTHSAQATLRHVETKKGDEGNSCIANLKEFMGRLCRIYPIICIKSDEVMKSKFKVSDKNVDHRIIDDSKSCVNNNKSNGSTLTTHFLQEEPNVKPRDNAELWFLETSLDRKTTKNTYSRLYEKEAGREVGQRNNLQRTISSDTINWPLNSYSLKRNSLNAKTLNTIEDRGKHTRSNVLHDYSNGIHDCGRGSSIANDAQFRRENPSNTLTPAPHILAKLGLHHISKSDVCARSQITCQVTEVSSYFGSVEDSISTTTESSISTLREGEGSPTKEIPERYYRPNLKIIHQNPEVRDTCKLIDVASYSVNNKTNVSAFSAQMENILQNDCLTQTENHDLRFPVKGRKSEKYLPVFSLNRRDTIDKKKPNRVQNISVVGGYETPSINSGCIKSAEQMCNILGSSTDDAMLSSLPIDDRQTNLPISHSPKVSLTPHVKEKQRANTSNLQNNVRTSGTSQFHHKNLSQHFIKIGQEAGALECESVVSQYGRMRDSRSRNMRYGAHVSTSTGRSTSLTSSSSYHIPLQYDAFCAVDQRSELDTGTQVHKRCIQSAEQTKKINCHTEPNPNLPLRNNLPTENIV